MEQNQNLINLSKWISASKSTKNILVFKKEFKINKGFKSAKLLICGLGYFDAFLNYKKIDKHYFKPNVSDYRKRSDPVLEKKENYFAYYLKYDVSRFLEEDNLFLVNVAPGYFHNNDKHDAPNYDYGKTRLIYLFIIEYEKETKYISSDASTLVAISNNRSTLFEGDRVDFVNVDLSFSSAKELNEKINLKPSISKDDILDKTFKPNILFDSPNKKIFDFGINHTGGIKCLIKGKRNTVISIKYAETLNNDDSLNFLSSSYPEINPEDKKSGRFDKKYPMIQENKYILSGNFDQIDVLFSWRCYRYIEITSESEFEIKNLESLFIHSDIPVISNFSCSEPIFNKIYDCYIQTQLCNLHSGLTTDCPHREKVSYTGDGQIIIESLLYNFDCEQFLSKWLDDIIASQAISGYVPTAAPDMACGGGYFWGYAIIKIPLMLYKFTGKKEYIERSYNSMKRWIRYLSKSRDEKDLISTSGRFWLLGDWLSPDVVSSNTCYINSVCFYLSLVGFINAGEILSMPRDEQLYHLLDKTKKAINNEFFNKETMTYSNNVQGETVLALYADIVEPQYIEAVQKKVIEKYKNNKYHIDTGIVLTPILFEHLIKYSCYDEAYNLLTQVDYPSYAYLLNDETTIPEHWSKKWIPYKPNDDSDEIIEIVNDVSHCHPMFGSITSWIEKYVGGLDLTHYKDKLIIFEPKYVKKIRKSRVSYKDIEFSYICETDVKVVLNVPRDYKGRLFVPTIDIDHVEVKLENGEMKKYQNLPIDISEGKYTIDLIVKRG